MLSTTKPRKSFFDLGRFGNQRANLRSRAVFGLARPWCHLTRLECFGTWGGLRCESQPPADLMRARGQVTTALVNFDITIVWKVLLKSSDIFRLRSLLPLDVHGAFNLPAADFRGPSLTCLIWSRASQLLTTRQSALSGQKGKKRKI